jgi:probable rRNA maturation factor
MSITFDLSESKTSPTIGEIYISVDRVKENAITHKTTFELELHRVIFHGALHLCGYKDKIKKDALLMRDKEEYCLSMYFE